MPAECAARTTHACTDAAARHALTTHGRTDTPPRADADADTSDRDAERSEAAHNPAPAADA